jgi:hypothetical protein
MAMRRTLSELKNEELARLILRELWRFQDASGASMGRSLRSALLEAAMELLPPPQDIGDPDALTLFDLYEEAAKGSRREAVTLEGQTHFPDIGLITDRELAIMLIDHLRSWYEDDAKENPKEPLVNEQTVLKRALVLLSMPCGNFAQEDLLCEADERQHALFDIKLKDEN